VGQHLSDRGQTADDTAAAIVGLTGRLGRRAAIWHWQKPRQCVRDAMSEFALPAQSELTRKFCSIFGVANNLSLFS
jgi:hypothetical protein